MRLDEAGIGEAPHPHRERRLRSDTPTAQPRGDHEGGRYLLTDPETLAEPRDEGAR